MVSHLLERISLNPGTPLLDVFCGVGLFSAFFAAREAQVTGVELSPAACDDFSVNLDEFDDVSLYQASAAEVLPSLDLNPQVVLLDPPRAGLEIQVVEALLAKAPQQIAYISCDPATLGRDLARLIAGGYRLLEVTPFDLFPQTYHIESISLLEKS
jgi:23S rRNA (uracil1939-C5)-methyltransferase